MSNSHSGTSSETDVSRALSKVKDEFAGCSRIKPAKMSGTSTDCQVTAMNTCIFCAGAPHVAAPDSDFERKQQLLPADIETSFVDFRAERHALETTSQADSGESAEPQEHGNMSCSPRAGARCCPPLPVHIETQHIDCCTTSMALTATPEKTAKRWETVAAI